MYMFGEIVGNSKKILAPTAVALAVAALVSPMAAFAQTAANNDSLNLDKVVITASPEGRSKMKQSQSVSTIDAEQIIQSQPNSAAELLRSVPGIRSEASSGDGNANITVRGVPISAGGSRYVQIQEDGLPILLMGDFNFVTADMFTRIDYGTQGLEAVRGGGASTLASNSPGGVLNFRSKTGDEKNRTIGFSYGSNSTMRADFGIGDAIDSTSRYQLSGYVRNGEGARDTGGVKMERGYQLRANYTKDLGAGSMVRLNFKHLDDKSPTQLTVPVRVVNGQIVQAPGIDPRTYTPYSSKIGIVPNWGMFDGQATSVNEGLRVKQTALGAEFGFNFGEGWRLNNNFRWATTSGIFAGVMPADTIAAPYTNYTGLFLGAKFKDLGSIVNDFKVTKSLAMADKSKLNLTGGLFYMRQNAELDWEIGGFPSLTAASHGGTSAAYTSFYKRYINMTYVQTAPYFALGYEAGALNLDASVRLDGQTAKGSWIGGGAPAPQFQANYKSRNTSFSLGANYAFDKNLSAFARISDGASLNSDRVLFTAEGKPCALLCLVGQNVPVNKVKQFEIGTKWRNGPVSAFATLFNAKTDESNYDLTTSKASQNKYDAKGLELEAAYNAGAFRINGGLTYTDAQVKASNNPAYVGKTPNRQAALTYQIAPSYKIDRLTFGAQLIGTSSSRDAQTTALEATLPGYSYVNLFASFDVNQSLNLGLSVNNAFNKVGYTELNDERAAARSINGRTFKLAAKFSF